MMLKHFWSVSWSINCDRIHLIPSRFDLDDFELKPIHSKVCFFTRIAAVLSKKTNTKNRSPIREKGLIKYLKAIISETRGPHTHKSFICLFVLQSKPSKAKNNIHTYFFFIFCIYPFISERGR